MKTSILIHPEELSKKWIERARRFGYDTLALHPRGGRTAPETLAEMLAWLKTPACRALIDEVIAAGLQIEYELHAVGYLLPRALFAQHPEYFRMNENGVRTPDANLCFSNPAAIAIVRERAVALARALYRSTKNFYFWADDVRGATCLCEHCRALSAADKNLLLMNEIADAVRAEIPGAQVACLAYLDTLAVPEKIKPHNGIFLEYAPIDRDMRRPVSEQGVDQTGGVSKLIDFFSKQNAKVLDYWMDNSLFSRWQKPPKKYEPNRAVISADVQYYTSLGFECISSFGCYLGDDYEALYGEPDIVGLK